MPESITEASNSRAPYARCAFTYDLKTSHAGWTRSVEKNGFVTGNVWANTQFSNFIRPSTDRFCNDRVFRLGELQEWDFKPYYEKGIPLRVLRRFASRIDEHGGGALHLARLVIPHRVRLPDQQMFGAILTDRLDHVLDRWILAYTPKATSVVDAIEAWLNGLPHEPLPIRKVA